MQLLLAPGFDRLIAFLAFKMFSIYSALLCLVSIIAFKLIFYQLMKVLPYLKMFFRLNVNVNHRVTDPYQFGKNTLSYPTFSPVNELADSLELRASKYPTEIA